MKKFNCRWVSLGLLIFVAACSSEPKLGTPSEAPAPTRASALTREAATARSKQIDKVSYTLWLGLSDDSSDFEGRTIARFDLKPKARDFGKKIFLDFEEGVVRTLSVNGVPVKDEEIAQHFDGHRISFDMGDLQANGNRIEIAYTHPFGHSGSGLHRFKDPVDAKVYLYSDFEPYDAHQMFPCFDQPDLKASYELTVEAPKDWEVISNTLEKEVTKLDGRKSWAFPPSPIFSTYLFALHAGPYSVWKSKHQEIPIRLFARKSLAKYVDSAEWLEITKNGLDFFGVQFGYPYPFGKYDQIIVPDYNHGAMENVGAVTFSENYIYRTKVTVDRRRGRANTILHEMAHMWFGDLVTMRWWNGLWLNESFATFMAAWAVDEATKFRGSWQSFFGTKRWAYWEDQLVTTHPIELPVPDTDHATANFDGITYGKGASVLKQLNFYLGDEFKEGLQRYFQKYAYKNTSLVDFMKMLSEASSRELNTWQRSWLQTSGVNTVRTEWECAVDPEDDKNKITKMEVIQTPDETSRELRPHKTQIAIFAFPKGHIKAGAPLVAGKPFELSYSGAKTPVTEAIGKPCPQVVFPNFGDHDYTKVDHDPESLKILTKHLPSIADPLVRQMIWHCFWEMVLDGKLSPMAYAEMALKFLDHEKDTLVLSHVLSTVASSSANEESIYKFLNIESRKELGMKWEPFVRSHLLSASAGTDQQLVWYHAFRHIASSPKSLPFIQRLLNGKSKLRGFNVDQERRWELVEVLARNGLQESPDWIAAELKKDPTDTGSKHSISAEASIPDDQMKKKWLSLILKEKQEGNPELLPLAKLREAMGSYHVLGQDEFIRASVDSYFTTLPKFAYSNIVEDEEYARRFARMMFPSLCETEIVEKTSAFLSANPNLPAPVAKSLRVARQEEERCVRARKQENSS